MRLIFCLSTGLILALLSGCGGGAGQEELRDWMDQERRNMRPTVQPLLAPRKFEPFVYEQQSQIDPFDIKKLDIALQKLASSANKGNQPDLDRRRDPMEAFPLDTITMVGTIVQGGKRVALVRVNRTVYQVRQGEYIGQNFGRIAKITEAEITINETVQDAAGDWVERTGSLQLQETAK
jgi:type IV pilus assembly protein PilP